MTRITMHFASQPCRRLIASECVPRRAGQATHIQLQISLEELTRRPAGTPTPDDTDLAQRFMRAGQHTSGAPDLTRCRQVWRSARLVPQVRIHEWC